MKISRTNSRINNHKSTQKSVYNNTWIIGVLILISSVFFAPLKIVFLGNPIVCEETLLCKGILLLFLMGISLMIKLQANYLHIVKEKSNTPLFINNLLVVLIILYYKKIDLELIFITVALFFSIQNMIYVVERECNKRYVFNSIFLLTIASLFAPKLLFLIVLYLIFIIYFKAWSMKMISVVCLSFLSVWSVHLAFLSLTNNLVFVDNYLKELTRCNTDFLNFGFFTIGVTIIFIVLAFLSFYLFNRNRTLYSLAERDGFFLVITLYISIFFIWFFSYEKGNYYLINSLVYPATILFSSIIYNLKKRKRTGINVI